MKKLESVFQALFIAAFFLFLILGMLGTYLSRNKTYSYLENRLLASRPSCSADSILDGAYFSDLETYLADHAAGRSICARLDAQLSRALGRPVINSVVVQEDILLPWNRYETISEENISIAAKQMADNLSSVRDCVQSYGGKYYYVAVPCQYAYYQDQYPPYLNNRSEFTRLSLECLGFELEQKRIAFIDMGARFDSLGHIFPCGQPLQHLRRL